MIVIEDYFQVQQTIKDPLLCVIREVKTRSENLLFKYLCYKVQVYNLKTFLSLESPEKSLQRRYNDFVSLHNSLEDEFPNYFLPPLPPKRFLSKMFSSPEFDEHRLIALIVYLNAILALPRVKESQSWERFVSEETSWKRISSTPSPQPLTTTYMDFPPKAMYLRTRREESEFSF